ncbi:MAG: magnesium chelatase, partial [Actinomycetota bacterium]|nr:magnesium chelatase [Actinomycetota bacterium]
MLASVATFAIEGIDSREVTVEVDLRRGLPVFTVVGLPDAAVREARERVRAALLNSGLEFPLQRLTANLAPADLRKAGPSFDLALAVAVLAASGQIPADGLPDVAVCGELSLGGALRPVRGAVAMAFGARGAGFRRLIVPVENAAEAALVEGLEVLGVPDLDRIAALLRGRWRPP